MDRREFLKAAVAGMTALGLGGPVLARAAESLVPTEPIPRWSGAWYAEPILIFRCDMEQLPDPARYERYIEMKVEQAKRRLRVAMERDGHRYPEDEVEVDGPFHVEQRKFANGADASWVDMNEVRTVFLAMARA